LNWIDVKCITTLVELTLIVETVSFQLKVYND